MKQRYCIDPPTHTHTHTHFILLQTLLDELSRELQLTKGYLGEEKTKCKQFEEEVLEARQASDNLADQLLSVREDKIKLEEEIKAINKVINGQLIIHDSLMNYDILVG